MPWHVLLILLIPVAVVILSSLFRTAEQKNRRERPGAEVRTPPRRPTTDLDRFLEEARRRRQPPERREVPDGTEVTLPAKPPPPQRPQRQVPPVRPREARVPPRRTPVLMEEARPTSPPIPFAQPAAVAEAVPAKVSDVPPPPPAQTTTRQQGVSPVRRQVLQLLRAPRSAATAMVLHEVFGPPLCKRRR
jgi:hypothetical protein